MMDFWSGAWGDFGTIIGIAVSVIGLTWAIWEAHGARSASEVAKAATTETSSQIGRHIQSVELRRAIGLIEQVKTLHDSDRWESSREHYQSLREMLSDVISRCSGDQIAVREGLATARVILRDMEDFVRPRVAQGISEGEKSRLNQSLNLIQSNLEELASSLGFGDSQEEAI